MKKWSTFYAYPRLQNITDSRFCPFSYCIGKYSLPRTKLFLAMKLHPRVERNVYGHWQMTIHFVAEMWEMVYTDDVASRVDVFLTHAVPLPKIINMQRHHRNNGHTMSTSIFSHGNFISTKWRFSIGILGLYFHALYTLIHNIYLVLFLYKLCIGL